MAKRYKYKTQKVTYGESANDRTVKLVAGILALVLAVIGVLAEKGVINILKIRQFFGSADTPAVNAQMSVHFIDVGQGDCTLIVSDGEAMLVDAGESECSQTVVDYLDEMGITSLKYVVGTHPHSDHIGGLSSVIDSFEVENVILPAVPKDMTPTTSVYEKLLLSIKNNGLKIHKAKDEKLSLGTSEVEVFAPLGEYSNLNNYSVCLKITHGKNTFLLTGDTEEEGERDFVMRNKNSVDAKVLKLGHHGSKTASQTELLDAVTPRYAVISCGEGNKYDHPHTEVLERVEKYADYTLRTDKTGTVIFMSDGEGLSVVDADGQNLIEE